jgi:hypothetical protein
MFFFVVAQRVGADPCQHGYFANSVHGVLPLTEN